MEWVSTTFESPWVTEAEPLAVKDAPAADVIVDVTKTAQTIEGFGTCFNELGWTSLSKLSQEARDGIMKEMFSPGVGANFTICRMPLASNDFSLDYYSYDETDGDFEMKDFSIEHDRSTLIPFILAAKAFNPDMKLWASPWCPPIWMKWNKHYASRSTSDIAKRMADLAKMKKERQPGEETFFMRVVDNGLPKDRETPEGTDAFIQEDAYYKAYALYFSKFIDAYKQEGIDIFGVMPQNEFNSNQPYPSCVWTLKGLSTFMGKYLGPAMEAKGVEMMYGTIERAHESMIDSVMQDPDCRRYIKSMGFQWAGKKALLIAGEKYPEIRLMQTEQECGNGKNDWKGAAHSWDLMKHYLGNGVSIYEYWNTSLEQGGISHWGWSQNSLVTVSPDGSSFSYTPEYYIMKHVSHYVMPGAKRIVTGGEYTDVLAFVNPDGGVAVIAGNAEAEDKTVSFNVGGRTYSPTLKANSVNTFLIK